MNLFRPHLSIVIPIYNAELFLHRLLVSITNQDTDFHYEIILIDDGSTDNSYNIVRSFLPKEKIYYHRQNNSGPGKARNTGLRIAKGEFILFADADDYFSDNAINTSISSIISTDFDFVSFGASFMGPNGKISSLISYSIAELENYDILKIYLNGRFIKTVVWNKIYRADFLRKYNIQFTNHFGGEDLLFTFKVCLYAKKISIIPDLLYFHTLDNLNSFTNKILPTHFSSTFDILNDELNLLKSTSKNYDLIEFQIYAIKAVFHLCFQKAYISHSYVEYMNFIILVLVDNEIFSKKLFTKLLFHPLIFLRLFLYMHPSVLWALVRVLKFFRVF